MHRYALGTMILVLFVSGGCAARSVARGPAVASAGYRLIRPPDVPDTHYPGGSHIQAGAPLEKWQQVAAFTTREECETSRIDRIDDSIDQAREEFGAQAKFQLSVRRAVNARCVGAP
ncbi:MAG: hypothetical protein ABIR79_06985 [Candidatus Binatia bacterium]